MYALAAPADLLPFHPNTSTVKPKALEQITDEDILALEEDPSGANGSPHTPDSCATPIENTPEKFDIGSSQRNLQNLVAGTEERLNLIRLEAQKSGNPIVQEEVLRLEM